MKNAVVVTGADGFIGSHFVRYLSKLGITVYALIMVNSPKRDCICGIHGVHVVEYDLMTNAIPSEELPQSPCAFFHLAWAGVSPEERDNFDTQMDNVRMAMNAVRIASGIRAQKFILPGSTMEYINSDSCIGGSTLPRPQNAYGAAKVAARFFCSTLCDKINVPFIYTVIASIYSADRIDNNVIYYTIQKLINRECPSLTALIQQWDYVHIDDVTHALYLIAESGRSGAFYVIGHGDNWPLSRYIEIIRDLIDEQLPLGIGEIPYRNGIIPNICVDLSTLTSDTGFVPEISFEDGIQTVIQEMRLRMG